MFKKLFGLSLIASAVVLCATAYKYSKLTVCDIPIYYQIGQVDPKFNISVSNFATNVQEASTIWNNLAKNELLISGNKNPVIINLVFDERQALQNQISSLEKNVELKQTTLESQISQYRQQVASFTQKQLDLNSQIDSWNKKGGAPSDIYSQLKEDQQNLISEANRLNALAKTLNQNAGNFNSQINILNTTINDFNSTLTQKPEEGIYNPTTNSIDIYLNTTKTELVHTIAHELGHALTLNHTTDPNSLMYPFTNNNIIPTPQDIAELNTYCKQNFLKKLIFNVILK